MLTCRTCGAKYDEGGDGYDDECPSCADKSFEAECPEEEPSTPESTPESVPAGRVGWMDTAIAENIFSFAEMAAQLKVQSEDWTELVVFSVRMSRHFEAAYVDTRNEDDGGPRYEAWRTDCACSYYEAIEAFAAVALIARYGNAGMRIGAPTDVIHKLTASLDAFPREAIEAEARA